MLVELCSSVNICSLGRRWGDSVTKPLAREHITHCQYLYSVKEQLSHSGTFHIDKVRLEQHLWCPKALTTQLHHTAIGQLEVKPVSHEATTATAHHLQYSSPLAP